MLGNHFPQGVGANYEIRRSWIDGIASKTLTTRTSLPTTFVISSWRSTVDEIRSGPGAGAPRINRLT